MTRILFVGESWQGSSARSLREALATLPAVEIADIGEDHFIPRYRRLPLRLANRLLFPLQRRELKGAILHALGGFHPDAVLIYKGFAVNSDLVQELRQLGYPLVNVFPDCSPHAYGKTLKQAIGAYDLVISTKPFHPRLWGSVYGYTNPCVCVPHGYDPEVHFWPEPPQSSLYDLALCATWRPEYHRLMQSLGQALGDDRISVAIAGSGWEAQRSLLPAHWQYVGPRTGRAYGDFLRQAKIALAPVHREVVIHGVRQPGDEDTTRTYELAAAYCFFLHQRTDFVSTLYDGQTEVPLWNDAADLADLIRRWLPDEAGRRAMAARAHARAVPAYSIPQRAASVLQEIKKFIPGVNAPRLEA
jgi:glycosyltransferase involved in cell wall biosynthesis